MKLLLAVTLLAVASAFTSQPNVAFKSAAVVDTSVAEPVAVAHRNRKATIVMDGKANGTLLLSLVNVGRKEANRHVYRFNESTIEAACL